MGRLDGKVAVITGATSGIGLRTAEIFVARGCEGRRRRPPRAGGRGAGEEAWRPLRLPADRRHGRRPDAGADLPRGGKIRQDRLPVQQCRRPGADRRHRRSRRRAFRRRDGDAGAQRHARHETRRALHEETGIRQHHQQRQHRRAARRLFFLDGLRRGQGCGDPFHQMRGDGTRRVRRSRQLDLAGCHRDRNHSARRWACRPRPRRRRRR